MKNKFKYRKALKEALTTLGIKDVAILEGHKIEGTNRGFNRLINPQRRVLKTILSQDLKQQALVLANFQSQAAEINKQRDVDNKMLENG
jgi:hypothetical protein